MENIMDYDIYLGIEDGRIKRKTMSPVDTIDYKFKLSELKHDEKKDQADEKSLERFNKINAIKCHSRMMELRLEAERNGIKEGKLVKLDKYYQNVLSSYLDYFEDKNFQLPLFKIVDDSSPAYAMNLKTGTVIDLTPKQSHIIKLLHKRFFNSKIGEEWLWFSQIFNMLDDRYKNPNWNSMTDVFEKESGRAKLEKLCDVKSIGSRKFYRMKVSQ